MKIKNILPVILLGVLTASTSLAQEKQPLFYIKAYAGDAVITPGSDGVRPSAIFGLENGSTGNYSYSKKGLGAGINYGFGIEKPLGRIFSVGLDVSYLHGKTIFSSYSVYPPTNQNVYSFSYIGSAAYSLTTFVPSVSANIFQKSSYAIYTKMGIIVATKIKNLSTEKYDIEGNGSPLTEVLNMENRYGTEKGFTAAIGARINISGALKATVEISDNLLSVSPRSTHQYGFVSEGYDVLIDDNITYIKSNSGVGTSNATATGNNIGGGSVTATDVVPSFNQHINNIIVNIGLAFAIK
ncbi:hypothetical protein [Mucilaginibacter sp. BT774]|uniref:hypothetical protein n=1 Tax=Mucilaginibacter sp. BT774 TaxID=3062276 RepID=UPI0026759214|nr:hypothetical protein [Mucilaginibacter sp. BT774]MDO3628185.1 hypothetical protein [Mucilaginibacter sp. BT774]